MDVASFMFLALVILSCLISRVWSHWRWKRGCGGCWPWRRRCPSFQWGFCISPTRSGSCPATGRDKKTRAQGPGKSNREVHKMTRLCDGMAYPYSMKSEYIFDLGQVSQVFHTHLNW